MRNGKGGQAYEQVAERERRAIGSNGHNATLLTSNGHATTNGHVMPMESRIQDNTP